MQIKRYLKNNSNVFLTLLAVGAGVLIVFMIITPTKEEKRLRNDLADLQNKLNDSQQILKQCEYSYEICRKDE